MVMVMCVLAFVFVLRLVDMEKDIGKARHEIAIGFIIQFEPKF